MFFNNRKIIALCREPNGKYQYKKEEVDYFTEKNLHPKKWNGVQVLLLY